MEDSGWNNTGFDVTVLAHTAVTAAIAAAKSPPNLLDAPGLELSVVLSGDEAVRAMNRDCRNKDKPTNVLSFATLDGDVFIHQETPFHLGDIILAFETLKKEAEEQDKRIEDHFTHLLVHGTLHLLGYDHMKINEAEEMESLEIHILKSLGIENPYKNMDSMPE